MNAMSEAVDPVFALPWTPQSLADAYEFFQIKDEASVCPCTRRTKRVFDGLCWTCHVTLYGRLGRKHCPPLP